LWMVRTEPAGSRTCFSSARADASPTATCAASRRERARLSASCSWWTVGEGAPCSTAITLTPGVASPAAIPYWPVQDHQRFAWRMRGRRRRTAATCAPMARMSSLLRTAGTTSSRVPGRAAATRSPTSASTASTAMANCGSSSASSVARLCSAPPKVSASVYARIVCSLTGHAPTGVS
jgi:hypothetical protein